MNTPSEQLRASLREIFTGTMAHVQEEDLDKAVALITQELKEAEGVARLNTIERLISDAKDELSHEKAYINNQVNITFYENVIKFLEGRYELKALTPTNKKEIAE